MTTKNRIKWSRVSRDKPCPICGHHDWCGVSNGITRCCRVQSDQPSTGSDGIPAWLHSTKTMSGEFVEPTKQTPKLSSDEVTAIATKCFDHKLSGFKRDELSWKLGVPVWALESMMVGVGWDKHDGREWSSWPMRSPNGAICGISRRYSDCKKTYPGSRNGLFMPTKIPELDEVWVVEGGSDTCAGLAMGKLVIGRPSCSGGANMIAAWLPNAIRRIIVWGERDHRPCALGCKTHCHACWPGLYGARHVAKELVKTGRLVGVRLPSGKDLRSSRN